MLPADTFPTTKCDVYSALFVGRACLIISVFLHVQVGYSQSLSPVSSRHGPAPIPRPFQAFRSLLPIQRGKINDDGPYVAEQHPH